MDDPFARVTVDEDHSPSPAEERVLRAFKHDAETCGECRMTSVLIRERLEKEGGDAMARTTVQFALEELAEADWVIKISRGLWELVDDPRDAAEAPRPQIHN